MLLTKILQKKNQNIMGSQELPYCDSTLGNTRVQLTNLLPNI